jgi:hypothetical protein
MAAVCTGNYFLIIMLIVLFGFLYVYVANYRSLKERFEQQAAAAAACVDQRTKYIVPQDKLALIQGLSAPTQPIEPVSKFDSDPSATTIDGKPGSPSQMFMFAFNKVSPDCCPSPYSSSQGCVCMTNDQLNFLNQRGNNSRFNKCEPKNF